MLQVSIPRMTLSAKGNYGYNLWSFIEGIIIRGVLYVGGSVNAVR